MGSATTSMTEAGTATKAVILSPKERFSRKPSGSPRVKRSESSGTRAVAIDDEDAVAELEGYCVVELLDAAEAGSKEVEAICTPTVAAVKTSTGAASRSAASRAGCPKATCGL